MKITSIVCVVATRSDDSTKFEEFFSFANHQQLIEDSVLKIFKITIGELFGVEK